MACGAAASQRTGAASRGPEAWAARVACGTHAESQALVVGSDSLWPSKVPGGAPCCVGWSGSHSNARFTCLC